MCLEDQSPSPPERYPGRAEPWRLTHHTLPLPQPLCHLRFQHSQALQDKVLVCLCADECENHDACHTSQSSQADEGAAPAPGLGEGATQHWAKHLRAQARRNEPDAQALYYSWAEPAPRRVWGKVAVRACTDQLQPGGRGSAYTSYSSVLTQ